MKYGRDHVAKLQVTWERNQEILRAYDAGETQTSLAQRYNVSKQTIYIIVKKRYYQQKYERPSLSPFERYGLPPLHGRDVIWL